MTRAWTERPGKVKSTTYSDKYALAHLTLTARLCHMMPFHVRVTHPWSLSPVIGEGIPDGMLPANNEMARPLRQHQFLGGIAGSKGVFLLHWVYKYNVEKHFADRWVSPGDVRRSMRGFPSPTLADYASLPEMIPTGSTCATSPVNFPHHNSEWG